MYLIVKNIEKFSASSSDSRGDAYEVEHGGKSCRLSQFRPLETRLSTNRRVKKEISGIWSF